MSPPDAAAAVSIGFDRIVAPAAADVRPERLAPAVREVLRVVQFLDRGQLLLARRVAHPHRGVRIDRADREVLGHPFDEPERQALGAVLARLPVGTRRDVVLKRVDELVADDVVGVADRSAERQHDPAPRRFRHAAGAFTELTLDGVGLLEVGWDA